MTTDFENELRDLFREKAGEAPLATPAMPASAPRQVLRRGRLHQVGTVLGSAVVVVALIVGLGRRTHPDPGRRPRRPRREWRLRGLPTHCDDRGIHRGEPLGLVLGQRVADVDADRRPGQRRDGVCLHRPCPGDPNRECANPPGDETTSPIPVPHGLPMLQLSNADLGLTTNACERGLSADTAVLYVALDYERMIADGGAGLTPFPPGEPGLPPATEDGPCGHGSYAFFTVNGYPMFAWVGVGYRGERRGSRDRRDLLRDDVGDPRLGAVAPGRDDACLRDRRGSHAGRERLATRTAPLGAERVVLPRRRRSVQRLRRSRRP